MNGATDGASAAPASQPRKANNARTMNLPYRTMMWQIAPRPDPKQAPPNKRPATGNNPRRPM
jgi:hypothetical protein